MIAPVAVPSTSSSAGLPLLPPPPAGTFPVWIWYVLLGIVVVYVLATVIAFAAPNTRIGKICGYLAASIRDLIQVVRAPATPATSSEPEAPSAPAAPPAAEPPSFDPTAPTETPATESKETTKEEGP